MQTDFGHFEEDQIEKRHDIRLIKDLLPFLRPYRLIVALSILLICAITALDLTLPYLTKICIDRYIVPDVLGSAPATGRPHTRYLADLKQPEVRQIVAQYPLLFESKGEQAIIKYSDMGRLKPLDLIALRSHDLAGVAWMAATFLGIIVLHFILSVLNGLMLEYAGQSIMHDLRVKLYSHVQGLSLSFFTSTPLGRLVTRMTNDIENMHEFFTSIITVICKDMLLIFGIIGILLVMNLELATICMLILPLLIAAAAYLSRRTRNVFRQLRVNAAQINTKIQESIEGMTILQLFQKEGTNYERFRQLNHESYLLGIRQINLSALSAPIGELISAMTIALVIWYGGRKVLSGTLSIGALVAFLSYMKMFFRPVRDIAEKYNIMQSAMASSERIFSLLHNKTQIPDAATAPGKADININDGPKKLLQSADDCLSFNNVWFSYHDNAWILKDVSFSVRRAETIAIVGPTGAGKSSIVHLLERFYDPVKGSITAAGTDIRLIPKFELRAALALITQDVFLFADSLRNNIIAGNPGLGEEKLRQVIAAANLKNLISKLPQGLDTPLTQGGRGLSSGERQLIAFARALARDPEILILDEATSSVDTETERMVQEATLRLMENRTAIVVAHRLSTIRHADKIIVIHKGSVRETGTHDELIERRGIYYEMCRWQAW